MKFKVEGNTMAGFFDKVVVGINKGVNSVSEGSKNLVEKAKLNVQIQELENQKNQILQNMGALVYNLKAEGTLEAPQCDGMFQEITAINEKLAGIQDQIKALEAPKPQATTVPVTPVTPAATGVTCSCGFQNKEGAKFCANCGTAL